MFIVDGRFLSMVKKPKKDTSENRVIEFVLDELEPVSSAETSRAREVEPRRSGLQDSVESVSSVDAAVAPGPALDVGQEVRSAAVKQLELPKLPLFGKQDRARLQVQSPNNVYFYWS